MSDEENNKPIRNLIAKVVLPPDLCPSDPATIEAMLDKARGLPLSDDQVERMLKKAKGELPVGEREDEEETLGSEESLTEEQRELVFLCRNEGIEFPPRSRKNFKGYGIRRRPTRRGRRTVTTNWKIEELRRDAAANLAEQIVKDLRITKPPVNPFRVIRSEKRRIKALGDDFGDVFDGRLEYQRPHFLLFYNTKYDAWPHDGEHHPRVNFTIAHELAHFFIASHHHYLKQGGRPHGSHSAFVSDNNSEREADAFAAGLLLPSFLFKPKINTGELTYDRLDDIAREFRTSLLSAVIRAVRLSDVPSAVVGIRNEQIAWIYFRPIA